MSTRSRFWEELNARVERDFCTHRPATCIILRRLARLLRILSTLPMSIRIIDNDGRARTLLNLPNE